MAVTRYTFPMETLTLTTPDLLAVSPTGAAMPSLAGQLDVLRQQHQSVLEENAALRASKAALETRVAELEGEVRELRARLGELQASASPFAPDPNLPRQAHWVKPQLVCEVAFTERTREGLLRQPVFLRLRTDKAAREAVLEKPADFTGRKKP